MRNFSLVVTSQTEVSQLAPLGSESFFDGYQCDVVHPDVLELTALGDTSSYHPPKGISGISGFNDSKNGHSLSSPDGLYY